jgi:hypothetical protein
VRIWHFAAAVQRRMMAVVASAIIGLPAVAAQTLPHAPVLSSPMRLGVNAAPDLQPLIARSAGFPATRSVRAMRTCRSWRAMTDRLGETFIAARLRHTVLPNACAHDAVDAHEDRWAWPWGPASRDGHSGLDGDLPPRIAAAHGAWQVRCGRAGRRERCALVQSGSLEATAAGTSAPVPFTTHFVIDAVGGEERLIWRLHVRQADPTRTRDIDWNAPAGSVDLRVGDYMTTAPFSVCSAAGCMLELDLKAGAEIASRMWDGETLQLRVRMPQRIGQPASSPPMPQLSGTISPLGVRRGLPDLSLRRQHELQPAAGRPLVERTSTSAPPVPMRQPTPDISRVEFGGP